MNSKLMAALVAGALGLVPAGVLAEEKKVDCAAAEKKAAECTKAKSTSDDCRKAAEALKSCPKPKKEKKGGC